MEWTKVVKEAIGKLESKYVDKKTGGRYKKTTRPDYLIEKPVWLETQFNIIPNSS